MTINEIQDSIIDEFSFFDDWMDKYNLLIDLGKDLPVIDPKFKVKDFLIEGCQSKVWLHPGYDGKLITFTADSDAIITRGIVALLIKVLSNRTPVNIYDLGLIYEISIDDEHIAHITMTLTAPNCPMDEELIEEVKYKVAG